MSQTTWRLRFPDLLRWLRAGGDLSRRNHAKQRQQSPVHTLYAATEIPIALPGPLHTLSRSLGATFAPTAITGAKIKSP